MERSPLGFGDPEDLTGAVVLLCSPAGKFMTGTDIVIDGEFDCSSKPLCLGTCWGAMYIRRLDFG